MAEITLRVIEGADRGRVFESLATPITIGREEGNSIQLNDDRVSRFHIKIQEDNSRLVLTDLESTNGTKVNGEDIQLRILRFGDMIMVGRSVLLYGSREQIAGRMKQLRSLSADHSPTDDNGDSSLDFEADWSVDGAPPPLLMPQPPDLPERLSPAQAAQLCELLEYFHWRVRKLLNTVKPSGATGRVTLEFNDWQDLLDVQARIAEYLRCIGDPDASRL